MSVDRSIRLDTDEPRSAVIQLDPVVSHETREPWRVLIVDDYALMRQVVRLVCEAHPKLQVVGETGDGPDAIAKSAELLPDIVVLDVDIEGVNGVEVLRSLRNSGSSSRVLMLTGSEEPGVAFDCMRLAVDGYVDKHTAFESLGEIIDQVAGGTRVVAPGIEQRAARELGHFVRQQRESSYAKTVLTDRELAVLDLINMALTTTQMAHRLGLSERTIESHIAKLYKKLGVSTRTGAIRKAFSLGLIRQGKAMSHA